MNKKLMIILGVFLYFLANTAAFDITVLEKPSFMLLITSVAIVLFQQVYVFLGTPDE